MGYLYPTWKIRLACWCSPYISMTNVEISYMTFSPISLEFSMIREAKDDDSVNHLKRGNHLTPLIWRQVTEEMKLWLHQGPCSWEYTHWWQKKWGKSYRDLCRESQPPVWGAKEAEGGSARDWNRLPHCAFTVTGVRCTIITCFPKEAKIRLAT